MAFYSLSKRARVELVAAIKADLLNGFAFAVPQPVLRYFSDADTYIRKAAYQATGRIYFENDPLKTTLLQQLDKLYGNEDYRVRQTVINAAGEIGKLEFETVVHFFDRGLFDAHHSPRNAVIGSIKKMGEVNPVPVLAWARQYLYHPDKEIRREICHGIELRGRKHPKDILPLLKELQHDPTARVRKTLVHVIGQIAYKKGCLETVVTELQMWENRALIVDALAEIVDVHRRYREFAAQTPEEARDYIEKVFQ